MNRPTALFIAVLALAVGGYLFWDSRRDAAPSLPPTASPQAAPAEDGPSVPEEGSQSAPD